MRIVHLTPGHDDYARLTAPLLEEPLRSQWWADAESEHEPGTSYLMVVVDEGGEPVPAAWAGYTINGGVLHCRDNYVRDAYRGRTPDLYAVAYAARHDRVVTRVRLPAVTYLFAQPIPLHLADGWVYDTAPDSPGVSRAHPDGEDHPWWRLRWAPGTVPDGRPALSGRLPGRRLT